MRPAALTVLAILLAACVPARDRGVPGRAGAAPSGSGPAHVVVPVERRLGIGTVRVAPGDRLAPAVVQHRAARCTERPAYAQPLFGALSRACFLDRDGDGAFETALVRIGLIPFSYDLVPPVAYIAE